MFNRWCSSIDHREIDELGSLLPTVTPDGLRAAAECALKMREGKLFANWARRASGERPVSRQENESCCTNRAKGQQQTEG